MNWLSLALITFGAAAVQSATGFGFGLLSASAFLIILNSAEAIPIIIILTLAISVALLPKIWHVTPKRPLLILAASSAAGFPLGILAFLNLSLEIIKTGIAVLMIFTAVQATLALIGRKAYHAAGSPPRTQTMVGIGITSGAMTSCLGMPGPPVMAYLTALGMDKNHIRATLISLFVFSYATALAMQTFFVGVELRTWEIAAKLIPVALLGTFGGHLIAPHISQRLFQTLVVMALLSTGAYMLATTFLS